jgi:Protein of unknown function (DUF1236)
MRNQRNILLAGIAALALAGGTGLAAAQDTSQDHNGAQDKAPHAAMQKMNHGPGPGKMGQAQEQQGNAGANTQEQGQAGQNGRSKSAKMNAGKNTAAQNQWHKQGNKAAGTAAQNQPRNGENDHMAGRQDHGMRDHRMEGLQGNASGVNVQLNDEQRTQIRNTVIEARGAPKVDHVNFDVTVGAALPRTGVRIVPVPDTLVRIEPRWRGFRYFVYENEVVIVDPHDMKIVAVLMV